MPVAYSRYVMALESDTIAIPPVSLRPWFKTVHLNANFPITDIALKHCQDLIFNNANSLRVDIHHHLTEFEPSQKDIHQLRTNGSVFLDSIHRMVPSVKNVRVDVGCVNENRIIHSGLQYKTLFTRLFSSIVQLAVTRLEVRCGYFFDGLDWDTFNNQCSEHLVNIILFGGISDESWFEIVRRNSNILQTLSVGCLGRKDGFLKLISDRDGRCITYSNLWKLSINSNRFSEDDEAHVQNLSFLEDVVPFPNIQCLKIHGGSLLNDVLFRGNYHSLKFFEMDLTSYAATFLTKHRIFSTGKYTRLERVHLDIDNWYGVFDFGEYAQAAADIGRYAQSLTYIDYSGSDDFEEGHGRHLAIGFCRHLQNIEKLDLGYINMAFSDIFKIVKELSSLRYLGVYSISDTEMPQGMTLHQMMGKFNPLNSNFWALSLSSVDDGAENETAECLAILAILCPALAKITVEGGWFKDTWVEMLERKEFVDYRQLLEQVQSS